jgi:hypothetical protein
MVRQQAKVAVSPLVMTTMVMVTTLLLSCSSSLPLQQASSPSRPKTFAPTFQIKASVSVPQVHTHSAHNLQNHHDTNKIEALVKEKLRRIVAGYEIHGEKMKRTLEMEVELSSKVETCFMGDDIGDGAQSLLLLSSKLKEKKSRLEACLAVNDQVVHQLLLAEQEKEEGKNEEQLSLFHQIDFIPSAAAQSTGEYDDLGQLMGNGGMAEGGRETQKETDGYDTALQVIHHTARDWTVGAAPCRDETIRWIVRAIVQYYANGSSNYGHDLRVLVPGAGLGRLAYEISTCKDLIEKEVVPHVEANDSSVTMIFAAQNVIKMLQQQQQQEGRILQLQSSIFPFLSDPQVNEIDTRKRFEMEVFPDENAVDSYKCYYDLTGTHPNISFTVGDFVSTYSQQAQQNQYDVVATSFFIDTATNIYEYIFIMKHMLESNGIWVNCGPVQWHPCALLRPTVEQLKDMLQVAGFELLSWSIAEEAVAYRHPDDVGGKGLEARYTRSEAYRPLRFVARLSNQDADKSSDEDVPLKIQYSEYLNEVANGKTKVD